VLWQRAETTSELARLAYVLLGPRLTTVSIALVLVYNNGGLPALGGTDRVLIEYTKKISDPPTNQSPPKPLVAREPHDRGYECAIRERERNEYEGNYDNEGE
jgi:hypothetical protein